MSVQTVKRHSVAAQTINASGNTGVGVNALANLSDMDKSRAVVALINAPNAPTGTTPSLTFSLDASHDGGNTWFNVKTATALTAAGQVRLSSVDLIEPHVRVSWAITGAGATFTGVTIDLLFN
jgi:hypothetical protein